MSRSIKLVLYIVCAIGMIVFGVLMRSAYRQAAQTSEQRKDHVNRTGTVETTNRVESTNTAETTNSAEVTNAVTNTATTNLTEAVTNAATNVAATKKDLETEMPETAGVSTRHYGKMVTYALGALVFFLGLAGLVGYDVAHFLGTRAQEIMFNDEGQPTDPEYEKAEQMWANGQYLESVRAMREYLEKNPREQYVALRIAEIYEQNLNNPLAAALEYEEVLNKKLPPERWGWAAIHLANIYSGKMSQPDKAIALLRRIDAEYGQTAAANKARERLLQIDPEFVPAVQPTALEETSSAEPTPPASNLPPGFRPKS